MHLLFVKTMAIAQGDLQSLKGLGDPSWSGGGKARVQIVCHRSDSSLDPEKDLAMCLMAGVQDDRTLFDS